MKRWQRTEPNKHHPLVFHFFCKQMNCFNTLREKIFNSCNL
jgi:hypothetical protein